MREVRVIDIKVKIGEKEVENIFENSITGRSSVSSDEGVDIGIVVSKNISFKVFDPEKKLSRSLRGERVTIEYKVLNNNIFNKVFNEYIITEVERENSIIYIEGQDFIYNTEKNLSLITDREEGKVGEYLEDIKSHYKDINFIIPDKSTLDHKIKINTKDYSVREFLSFLSILNGGFTVMGNNGRDLIVKNLKDVYDNRFNIKDKSVVSIYDQYDEEVTINGISYKEDYIKGKKPFLYIKNNDILNSIDDVDSIIDNIYNKLKGIKFRPSNGIMFYEPDVEVGDFISFNFKGREYTTLISSMEYTLGAKINYKSSSLYFIDAKRKALKRSPEEIEGEPEPEPEPEPEYGDYILNLGPNYLPEGDGSLELEFTEEALDKLELFDFTSDVWARVDFLDTLVYKAQDFGDYNYKYEYGEGYEKVDQEGCYIEEFFDGWSNQRIKKVHNDYIYKIIKDLNKSKNINDVNYVNNYIKYKDGAYWVKIMHYWSGDSEIPLAFTGQILVIDKDADPSLDPSYTAYGKNMDLYLTDINGLNYNGEPFSELNNYIYNKESDYKFKTEGEKLEGSLYGDIVDIFDVVKYVEADNGDIYKTYKEGDKIGVEKVENQDKVKKREYMLPDREFIVDGFYIKDVQNPGRGTYAERSSLIYSSFPDGFFVDSITGEEVNAGIRHSDKYIFIKTRRDEDDRVDIEQWTSRKNNTTITAAASSYDIDEIWGMIVRAMEDTEKGDIDDYKMLSITKEGVKSRIVAISRLATYDSLYMYTDYGRSEMVKVLVINNPVKVNKNAVDAIGMPFWLEFVDSAGRRKEHPVYVEETNIKVDIYGGSKASRLRQNLSPVNIYKDGYDLDFEKDESNYIIKDKVKYNYLDIVFYNRLSDDISIILDNENISEIIGIDGNTITVRVDRLDKSNLLLYKEYRDEIKYIYNYDIKI